MRAKFTRSVALATAACVTVTTPLARAVPAGAPASKGGTTAQDQARLDAEKRLAEGLDRYAKGDYEGARLAFAQAYAVLASLDLLYNLARAEVKAGHPLEALVHIHQLLRDPRATPDDHAKADRLLEEANRLTGHIAVEAPDGAEILLDDVPSGEAPFKEPFDVTPGRHKVEARSPTSRRRLDVDAPIGEVVAARFAPDATTAPTVGPPVPLAPAPSPAPVERAAPPPPPSEASPPPGGTHERAYHASQSSAHLIVPISIGAAAVVVLGVGAGLGLVAQGKSSDAASFRATRPVGFCADYGSADCAQYRGILDSQQEATNVSRVLYVTGGVLALGAVVTYLVWPRGRSERHGAWIAPTPGGVSGGFVF